MKFWLLLIPLFLTGCIEIKLTQPPAPSVAPEKHGYEFKQFDYVGTFLLDKDTGRVWRFVRENDKKGGIIGEYWSPMTIYDNKLQELEGTKYIHDYKKQEEGLGKPSPEELDETKNPGLQ